MSLKSSIKEKKLVCDNGISNNPIKTSNTVYGKNVYFFDKINAELDMTINHKSESIELKKLISFIVSIKNLRKLKLLYLKEAKGV